MTATKTYNPDFKSRVEKYLERQHFMKHIGFEVSEIEVGKVSGSLDLSTYHHQQTGLVHGGVIATVADIVAGFAAYTVVAADDHVLTGELKISYLRAARGQRLFALGWVIKSGKHINFCEAEVYAQSHGRRTLVAKATTTMITI